MTESERIQKFLDEGGVDAAVEIAKYFVSKGLKVFVCGRKVEPPARMGMAKGHGMNSPWVFGCEKCVLAHAHGQTPTGMHEVTSQGVVWTS